jgi:hypothetical protein
MKFEVLLLHLQHDVMCCYAAPDTHIPHVSTCFLNSTLILVSRLGLGLPTGVSFTFLDQNFSNITPEHLVTRTIFCEIRANHVTPQKKENEISELQPARKTAMEQLVGRSSDRCSIRGHDCEQDGGTDTALLAL